MTSILSILSSRYSTIFTVIQKQLFGGPENSIYFLKKSPVGSCSPSEGLGEVFPEAWLLFSELKVVDP